MRLKTNGSGEPESDAQFQRLARDVRFRPQELSGNVGDRQVLSRKPSRNPMTSNGVHSG